MLAGAIHREYFLLQCLKKEIATTKELDLRQLGKVIIFRDRQTNKTFLLYIDITITIITIIVYHPLVPSKVDKLLASSRCDGERAHVETGDDDDDINHQNQYFISFFFLKKDDINKNDRMTMMVTMAKVKLKIKRCSELKGIRAGTFYTGTRGKTML